jgi:hypothetical protein
MKTSLPIVAYLNPLAPDAPEGMMQLDSRIMQGLPHTMALLPRWRAVLTLPTGLARTWLDLPPETLVSASLWEGDAMPAPEPPSWPSRPAPRLRLQRDGGTLAVLPLAAGLVAEVAGPDGRLWLRLQLRGWALHAGTVRGAGEFGSSLSLSVAAADLAADAFGPLPPSLAVVARLPVAERMESRSGFKVAMRLRRLVQLRERIR